MSTDDNCLNEITQRVIGCAYRVGTKLGCGFLEKCYENALAHEMRKAGLKVQQQVSLAVRYDEVVVGEYVADVIVENCIIVELKAIERLLPVHAAQCINYLAATRMPLCLLINFGKRVEIKRIAGEAYQRGTGNSSVVICAPSVANPE